MGSTVFNDDTTFSFCHFPMTNDVFEYVRRAEEVIERHKQGNTKFYEEGEDLGIVHGTVAPWFSFTGIKLARSGKERFNGIPKFSFGKYYQEDTKNLIPFAIEAHHALVDGFYVGKFVTLYQEMINQL